MAELKCEVSLESILFKAFAELAQNISDQYGINVTSVDIRWADISTYKNRKNIVTDISCLANKTI